MPLASILTATRSCAWPLKPHRSRPAPSTFHVNAPWLDEFKKELLSFPKGRHDDQIDALSQGLQRAFAPKPPTAAWGFYSAFAGR